MIVIGAPFSQHARSDDPTFNAAAIAVAGQARNREYSDRDKVICSTPSMPGGKPSTAR